MMKKNFNQYFKVPLAFFIAFLILSPFSVSNAVSSFKNQNYFYFLGCISLSVLALIFLLLTICYGVFSYREHKESKKGEK
jgi:hypothetical protein